MNPWLTVLILALGLLSPACGETAGSCADFADDAPAEGVISEGAVCGAVAIDAYADGLARVGDEGLVQVRFLAASQTPPDVGLNTWTLEVIDADCRPVESATVVARPVMIQHEHGTNPELHHAQVGSAAGRYELGPVDLMMAGWWQVTFTVTLEDGSIDTVVFDFCLEG